MRILIVVHGYPPAASGGTELYAEAHARTLAREHGDTVTVLTREYDPSRGEYAVRSEIRDGIRIVAINNSYRLTESFADTYANPALGEVANRIIDELQPDVAHIHHLTHLSTSIVDGLARRNIEMFMTLHDYWLLCHRGQLFDTQHRVCDGPEPAGCGSCVGLAGSVGRTGYAGAAIIRTLERALPAVASGGLRRAAASIANVAARDDGGRERARQRADHMRRVCGRIAHFFAPSSFLRDQFVRFGVASERITLSPYGIDHQSPPSRTNGTPSTGVLRIGFFGSLMVSKAPHLAIEAAGRLPAGTVSVDVFGDIAPYHGDDGYRATLEPLLARRYVRAHGAIAHDRVAAAMNELDVVVVPSVWPENSPFVIHEALLAQVPVVASRIGGIPELVEHGHNGLLFTAGDVDDLCRQLNRLSREPALLESLRSGGHPASRTITEDVSQMRSAYRSIRQAPIRPRLSAIVLNFQTPDETLLAVKALLQSDRQVDDVLVVNNGPSNVPESLHPALTHLAPSVSVIHTGTNLGFSGGMNLGIRQAIDRGATRVLLVNSDVIVPPDCIGCLEEALAATPDAGIAGPVMVARTDPGRIASLGINYSHATGRMRHHGFGALVSDVALPKTQVVDAVSGCVMLLTRDVLDAVGRLDDAYFFSFEDVDFCLRAQRAGFASIIAGDARVYHEGHRSIGHTTPARLYFAARNHLLLARRANGSALPLGWRAAPIVALNIAHAVRSTGGSLPARLAAVARGTRDYARGRFGAGAESTRLTR